MLKNVSKKIFLFLPSTRVEELVLGAALVLAQIE